MRALLRRASALLAFVPPLAFSVLALHAGTGNAGAADKPKPGAYCPLPTPGEKPSCLVPAEAEFGEFFRGVAQGAPSEAQLQRVEQAVSAGSGAENPYLALNALSYGYYVMAQAAAANPESDPNVIRRLERWNDLLATAYAVSGENHAFRAAVRSAALDLQNRAPALSLNCRAANGAVAHCDSTEAVLRGLSEQRDTAGIRGTLNRLIERIFSEGGSATQGTATP